jgi:hypothetical protein
MTILVTNSAIAALAPLRNVFLRTKRTVAGEVGKVDVDERMSGSGQSGYGWSLIALPFIVMVLSEDSRQ